MTEFLNMLLDQIGIIIVGGLILYYMTRGFADIRREFKADIAEARKETKADIADFRKETKADIVRVEGKVDNVMVELATTNGKLDNAIAEIAKANDKVDKLNNIVVANDTVIAMFKDNTKANRN